MNYEKSHNLLLHTIHYNLKKLNQLYHKQLLEAFDKQSNYASEVEKYLDNPIEKLPPLYENWIPEETQDEKYAKIERDAECTWILETLYPVLPLARENFPRFKYLFDWIEQSNTDGSMNPESCWCLGCKGNRTILFEERPSLGIAPAPELLYGINHAPAWFKLTKNMPCEEDMISQKYLHENICSEVDKPACIVCKEKHEKMLRPNDTPIQD